MIISDVEMIKKIQEVLFSEKMTCYDAVLILLSCAIGLLAACGITDKKLIADYLKSTVDRWKEQADATDSKNETKN